MPNHLVVSYHVELHIEDTEYPMYAKNVGVVQHLNDVDPMLDTPAKSARVPYVGYPCRDVIPILPI